MVQVQLVRGSLNIAIVVHGNVGDKLSHAEPRQQQFSEYLLSLGHGSGGWIFLGHFHSFIPSSRSREATSWPEKRDGNGVRDKCYRTQPLNFKRISRIGAR